MEKIEICVVRNDQIQVAIPVIVHEGAPTAPSLSIACDAGQFSHLFEPAVHVVVQLIFAVVGYVKIFPAIVVIVSDTYSLAPAGRGETCTDRHVSKRSIVIVVIKMIGGSVFAWEPCKCCSVYKKNVRPPVVVVVEDRYARAGALEDVCTGIIGAKNVCGSQSCFLSHVSEIGDLCSSDLSSASCGHPQRSKNDSPNGEQDPAPV